jgi:hypothetical protein
MTSPVKELSDGTDNLTTTGLTAVLLLLWGTAYGGFLVLPHTFLSERNPLASRPNGTMLWLQSSSFQEPPAALSCYSETEFYIIASTMSPLLKEFL